MMKSLLSGWFSTLLLSCILVAIPYFGIICQPWDERCTGGGCHHHGTNPFTGDDYCTPSIFITAILAVFLVLVLFKILRSGLRPPESRPIPERF